MSPFSSFYKLVLGNCFAKLAFCDCLFQNGVCCRDHAQVDLNGLGAAEPQVAVEERMGCGYGLCGTCAVPVESKDGATWGHVRACVDGPVFDPARVLWGRWLTEAPTLLPTPPEGFPVVRPWPA